MKFQWFFGACILASCGEKKVDSGQTNDPDAKKIAITSVVSSEESSHDKPVPLYELASAAEPEGKRPAPALVKKIGVDGSVTVTRPENFKKEKDSE